MRSLRRKASGVGRGGVSPLVVGLVLLMSGCSMFPGLNASSVPREQRAAYEAAMARLPAAIWTMIDSDMTMELSTSKPRAMINAASDI